MIVTMSYLRHILGIYYQKSEGFCFLKLDCTNPVGIILLYPIRLRKFDDYAIIICQKFVRIAACSFFIFRAILKNLTSLGMEGCQIERLVSVH